MSGDSGREAILARIRGSRATTEADHAAREYACIGRGYQRAASLERSACLAMFEDRLREYDAGVYHARSEEVRAVVRDVLGGRGVRRVAIPAGVPGDWLPDEIAFVPGDDLSALDLDRLDGVLTACTVAIAFTGTIVLQNVAGQGARRLSLVPDYHLCVVGEEHVVETVPEAIDLLQATASLPTTFISGPSATADIEMTRIRGVHGPRRLDVIVVSGEKRL